MDGMDQIPSLFGIDFGLDHNCPDILGCQDFQNTFNFRERKNRKILAQFPLV